MANQRSELKDKSVVFPLEGIAPSFINHLTGLNGAIMFADSTMPLAIVYLNPNPVLTSRGKFAVVRKCVEKCTGHEYAAKFMRKRRKGQDCRMEIIHEIAVLELATASPRVVSLHQVYEMASEMVLVLE